MQDALQKKEGEAIIAGIAVTDENRAKFAFSRPYLQFPARFIMPKAKSLTEPLVEKLKGERVGVIAGSAHERMLRDYFPDAKVVTFEKQEWMLADLKAGKIAAAFGDGMRLGFWLAGSDSADCCRFSGGPYLAPEYLGSGLAIAVSPDDTKLAAAFDYALARDQCEGHVRRTLSALFSGQLLLSRQLASRDQVSVRCRALVARSIAATRRGSTDRLLAGSSRSTRSSSMRISRSTVATSKAAA